MGSSSLKVSTTPASRTKLSFRQTLDISNHNEELAAEELETPVGVYGKIKTMLVIDADTTLAPQDAGELFWQQLFDTRTRSRSYSAVR